MNYNKHYNKLILRAKKRPTPEVYTENHHVIPKCLGGNDNKDNIVALTAEEHYVAHQLLVKLHPNNRNIALAAFYMSASTPYSPRPNNKLYGWIKRKVIEEYKKHNTNPFRGKEQQEIFYNIYLKNNQNQTQALKSFGLKNTGKWYYQAKEIIEEYNLKNNITPLPKRNTPNYNNCQICKRTTGSYRANFCSTKCRKKSRKKNINKKNHKVKHNFDTLEKQKKFYELYIANKRNATHTLQKHYNLKNQGRINKTIKKIINAFDLKEYGEIIPRTKNSINYGLCKECETNKTKSYKAKYCDKCRQERRKKHSPKKFFLNRKSDQIKFYNQYIKFDKDIYKTMEYFNLSKVGNNLLWSKKIIKKFS